MNFSMMNRKTGQIVFDGVFENALIRIPIDPEIK